MKQGPTYVQDLFVINVEVKDISHLFSHNLELKDMVLITLVTKLVITRIYWIIVIRILATALENWQPLCGCATCDICILRRV